MTRSSRNTPVAQLVAATNARNFRTFLLMAEFDRKAIGARIAQARHERGLTQDDLAALASFSKRALQEYEGGVRIPYKHLAELHRLLRKPTEWFLYGDQGPEPDEVDPDVMERLVRIEQVLEALVARSGPGEQEDHG